MSLNPHSLVLTPNVAGGVPQELVGQGAGAGIFTTAWQPPIIEWDEDYADSPDTELPDKVRSKPGMPTGLWRGRIIGTDGPSLQTYIRNLEQTIEVCRSRYGGTLVWTPPDMSAVTFDVTSVRVSGLDEEMRDMSMFRAHPELAFTFRPYGKLPQVPAVLSDVDPFSRDTITNQEWRQVAGAGTVAVVGGQLVQTSTVFKLLNRPFVVEDATAFLKVTMGTTAANGQAGPILKKLAGNDYLYALSGVPGGSISIGKVDSGVATSLASVASGLALGQTAWFRFNQSGNVLTMNLYATDPNGLTPTAPTKTLTYTLAGADATKFGVGVKGSPGIYFLPQTSTDMALDDWRLDSAWIESFDPQINAELLNVDGSADALAQVIVTDTANQARNHVEIGVDDVYYDPTLPVPTLIDSDVMVPLAGAGATRAGAYDPGASGNSVIRATLGPSKVAVCSTGPQLHIGTKKVKARVYCAGTGPFYVRLAYRIGSDGQWSAKDWVQVPQLNNLCEVDLATITLPEQLVAGQGWEGRIEAYTASGIATDTIDVDYSQVLPARRWGKARTQGDIAVSSYLIQERFNQTAGNLNGVAVGGGAIQFSRRSPATLADDATVGTVAWANTANAAASDNAYATASLGPKTTSHYLKATNHGFAIPAGGSIVGIQVDVERSSNKNATDSSVRLTKNGTAFVGNDKGDGQTIPLNDQNRSFGGPTDLWGTTWTVAEINAATFGAAYSVHSELAGTQTASVDWIRITVYYTDSAGNAWSVTNSAGVAQTDVTTNGSGLVSRSTINETDLNSGRYITAGGGTYLTVGTAITVIAGDLATASGVAFRGGVLARYSDGNNWVGAFFEVDYSSAPYNRIIVRKRVGGTVTTLKQFDWVGSLVGGRRIWFVVDDAGNFWVWTGPTNLQQTLIMVGNDAQLASGGGATISAAGKVGFYDARTGNSTQLRVYDDFEVWTPDPQPAVIDATGSVTIQENAIYKPTGSRPTYDGDYMRVAPSGREKRGVQLVAKARRQDVDLLPDDQIADNTRLAVNLTPRVVLL